MYGTLYMYIQCKIEAKKKERTKYQTFIKY